MSAELPTSDEASDKDEVKVLRDEIAKSTPSGKRRVCEKFVLAAISSIPWVGGFIATMASLKTEHSDVRGSMGSHLKY